ncbi:hypothetical protein STVA_27730 [Allostella vacuolata]|nr:hypothetical protein STVA_27730 [Stella vacuolata]
MNDIGRIRATVYRHTLPVKDASVAMPGERLVPAGGCRAPAGRAGDLFDPCRPDPQVQKLDSAGLPPPPLGPWAGQARARPPVRARARAAVPVPTRKPAAVKAAASAKAGPVKPTAKPAPTRKAASAKPARQAVHKPRQGR